jgi:hypothetical protein
LPAIIAVLLVSVVGFLGYRASTARQTTITDSADERISATELEERYGLHVRLIAVTAGGGMVDLRLKILDSDKATQLLGDPTQAPSLVADDSGTMLSVPEGSLTEDLSLRDGGVLILLFPNINGAIKPGTSVSVVFENERLEPILAQ